MRQTIRRRIDEAAEGIKTAVEFDLERAFDELMEDLGRLKDEMAAGPVGGDYVDLGLPSGTLWSIDTEAREYDYSAAVVAFGDALPRPQDLTELCVECDWLWDADRNGYRVRGNGGEIFVGCGWFLSGYSARDGRSYAMYVSERDCDPFVRISKDLPIKVRKVARR